LKPIIHLPVVGIRREPQHLRSTLIARLELGLPIDIEVRPGWIHEERFGWPKEHGRKDETSPTDAASALDPYVSKRVPYEEPAVPELRRPDQVSEALICGSHVIY
jgi:hypothetical protein